MRIEVTHDDIANGKRRGAFLCPIALAMKRATGRRWGVCLSLAECHSDGWTTVVALPPKANQFILAFDTKESVKPFSFEVDIK